MVRFNPPFAATVDNLLSFTDWGGEPNQIFRSGRIYARNRETGEDVWSRAMTTYNGGILGNNVSRSSPVIYKNTLIFGDVLNPLHLQSEKSFPSCSAG